MQSKFDVLMTRVNEVEERVNDIEDKLMARKEAEEKKRKQLKDHEERLREINDSLRRKNLLIIGVPGNAKRATGPESAFEQIIAEKFPNLGRETGMQIQEIGPPPNKSIKTIQHLIFNSETCKFQRQREDP